MQKIFRIKEEEKINSSVDKIDLFSQMTLEFHTLFHTFQPNNMREFIEKVLEFNIERIQVDLSNTEKWPELKELLKGVYEFNKGLIEDEPITSIMYMAVLTLRLLHAKSEIYRTLSNVYIADEDIKEIYKRITENIEYYPVI